MFNSTETYNKDNLAILQSLDEDTLQLMIERDYHQETAKDLISRIRRMKSSNTIEYNYSKKMSCGRLYSNKFSLQNCPKTIRNLLCEGQNYHDYDLENAHYNITLKLCKEHNEECVYIEKYCNERQAVLDQEHQSKTSMLMFLYQDKPKIGDSAFLKGLSKELINIKKKMTNLKQHLISTTEKTNKLSSLYSKVIGIYENEILLKVINHFEIENPVLVFDGFMTKKEYSLDEMEKVCGYKWTEKPINPIDITNYKSEYQLLKEEWEINNFWTREPLTRMSRISPNHEYYPQTKTDFLDKMFEKGEVLYEKWEKDPNKRCYDTSVFDPNPDFNNDRQFNTFKPFTIIMPKYENEPPQPKEFIDLVSSLCNYDSIVYNYLMSYIAHLFQKPHENPHTAIVLKGNQGTGKDTLTHIIDKLLGNNYLVKLSDMSNLVGGFNECLYNKLVVQINEMSGQDGYAYKNKIKDMITTETNVISRKYLPIQYQQNNVRWFMFSNNLVPVVIENTDRRFLICETADDYIGKTEYWRDFYRKLNDKEYLQQIYYYLMNYDISEWRPNNIPQTKDKRNLLINNNNPIHLFISTFKFNKLAQYTIKKVKYNVVSCQEFYEDFKCSDYVDDNKIKSTYFKKTVSALKSIDIKRIKGISSDCFAIDLNKLNDELKYYISCAEETEGVLTKVGCMLD
jgi:hypothetical protein